MTASADRQKREEFQKQLEEQLKREFHAQTEKQKKQNLRYLYDLTQDLKNLLDDPVKFSAVAQALKQAYSIHGDPQQQQAFFGFYKQAKNIANPPQQPAQNVRATSQQPTGNNAFTAEQMQQAGFYAAAGADAYQTQKKTNEKAVKAKQEFDIRNQFRWEMQDILKVQSEKKNPLERTIITNHGVMVGMMDMNSGNSFTMEDFRQHWRQVRKKTVKETPWDDRLGGYLALGGIGGAYFMGGQSVALLLATGSLVALALPKLLAGVAVGMALNLVLNKVGRELSKNHEDKIIKMLNQKLEMFGRKDKDFQPEGPDPRPQETQEKENDQIPGPNGIADPTRLLETRQVVLYGQDQEEDEGPDLNQPVQVKETHPVTILGKDNPYGIGQWKNAVDELKKELSDKDMQRQLSAPRFGKFMGILGTTSVLSTLILSTGPVGWTVGIGAFAAAFVYNKWVKQKHKQHNIDMQLLTEFDNQAGMNSNGTRQFASSIPPRKPRP
jgi:hypothetical protein